MSNSLPAQDWPQVLGTNRNGQAEDSQLSTQWPATLPTIWEADLGSGYAGPAVAAQKVLVPNRNGDREQLSAFDLGTGRELWQAEWEALYGGGLNSDDGPRCVPTIKNNVAICYDAAGSLTAIDISSGQVLWNRPLRQEYEADDGYFGAGSSPLATEELVIVCLGGEQAGVIALEISSGKTRWTSTAYDASYASPIMVESGGKQLALVVTRLNTLLMDPIDGSVFDEIRFGSRGPTVNAATPIAVGDNRYLLTASYGVGATLVRPFGTELQTLFNGSDLLYSQYNTPVAVNDRVIGINGREDVGRASLRAIDVDKEQVLWEETNFGTAHLLAVGDYVLALTLDGILKLIDGTADNYQELASTRLGPGMYRALPALVGNRLLVRSTTAIGQSKLMVFELP